MTDKEDICRCITDEAASLNIDNLKKNDTSDGFAHYSKPFSKNPVKKRSLY